MYTYYDRTAFNKQKNRKNAKAIEAFSVTVRLEFSRLPHLENMKTGAYESYLRREIRQREQAYRVDRQENNRTVLGKCKLSKTNPRNRPANPKPNSAKPICHCMCSMRREKYEAEMFAFHNQYIAASAAYRAGAYDTEFPYGSIKPPLFGISA